MSVLATAAATRRLLERMLEAADWSAAETGTTAASLLRGNATNNGTAGADAAAERWRAPLVLPTALLGNGGTRAARTGTAGPSSGSGGSVALAVVGTPGRGSEMGDSGTVAAAAAVRLLAAALSSTLPGRLSAAMAALTTAGGAARCARANGTAGAAVGDTGGTKLKLRAGPNNGPVKAVSGTAGASRGAPKGAAGVAAPLLAVSLSVSTAAAAGSIQEACSPASVLGSQAERMEELEREADFECDADAGDADTLAASPTLASRAAPVVLM